MFSLDILMPYYGRPDLLLRAVRSVQTLQDTHWRLTIVEDVHPEGAATERTILGLGDDRIRYLRNTANLGVSANTFSCLQMAELEHYTLMDYDDIMLPNYGRVVSSLFDRHPNAVVVQPGVEIIDDNDQPHRPLADRIKAYAGPVNRNAELSGEVAAVSLLRGNWTYAPSICYRKSTVQHVKFRPNTDSVHDLARLVDLMIAGGSLAVGKEIAFQYRRHPNSHSSTGAREAARFVQERQYYSTMSEEMRQVGWKSAWLAARLRLLSRLNALAQIPGGFAIGSSTVKALLAHALR